MSDQRKDDKQRDRLDIIRAEYEAFAARTVRILVALFVVLFISGVVSAYLVGRTSYLTGQNDARIDDIQQSRSDSILAACKEQNKRNARAYLFLKALPPSGNQPNRSKAETEKLLHGFTDALVGPVRNCPARVRRLVR